jgi:imidazolonepropionase-like amidohydrolase
MMSSEYMKKKQVFTADWIFDGTGKPPIQRGFILVDGDEIIEIGSRDNLQFHQRQDIKHTDLGNAFVLPGLIDMHSHLVLPGNEGAVETWMHHDDGILLMQAAKNARQALATGITTLADLGGRNQVTFTLREAIDMGLSKGPRLILSGRPLTRKYGHCWYFNGEADGPDEIRHAVRQLVGEGADIIKVMVTGGGTRGTDPFRPAYDQKELQTASNTAHLLGKKALAHCSSTEGIRMAYEAGFDVIIHAHFYESDGCLNFQQKLARHLANSSIFVNPTLNVNLARIQVMQAQGEELSFEEQAVLETRLRQFGEAAEMIKLGVKMVAGSDSGWVINPFGDFVSELEALVTSGLSNRETILTATRDASRALGCDHLVGTLEPGKKADMLVVSSDPTNKISALRKIKSIWLGGQEVII